MSKDNLPKIEGVEGKTVYVGLSGGVDSALSAAILKNSGAKVVGVFMKNWAGERGLQIDCPWEEDMDYARKVSEHLGIEFASFNFEKEYKKYVLDYFFDEYKSGRTPNPDILCNSEIKFKAFLERAIAEGADFIATGHYTGTEEREIVTGDGQVIKDRFLVKAVDPSKDQTYFLSNLTSEQLSKSIFPLAKLQKSEVRKLAKQIDLPNADRKDSQGICFIGDLDVQDFLRKYIKSETGDIVDIDTNQVVGRHDGMAYYTIGQREGIRIGGTGEPYFVVKKDALENKILVAKGRDNPYLFADKLKFNELHWINKQIADLSIKQLNELNLSASIRYHHGPIAGKITANNRFKFTSPQRAITPGQSVVFFTGDICLGRAIIEY